jgi:hypothetical protein
LLRARPIRSRYLISGDAVVVASTKNQQRAVAPILAPEALTRPGGPAVHAPIVPPLRLAATARDAAVEIDDGLRGAGIALSVGSLTIHQLFLWAALHLAYARRLVERASPSVVVVASNHDVAARALVRAAHEQRVPSVLVPHAPMLADLRLKDAPTDYVAVRGERELAWYAANGVESDQIAVVGNPALQPAPQLVPIPAGAPVVLAPSAYPDEAVADLVALMAAATDGDVVVTPHPRQRLEFLQGIAPPHWAFHTGHTYARLREGASAVVQSSSGVALESLLLGIPVVEIEPVGGRVYPFLDNDLVPSAGTAEELREQLELMRTRIVDRAYRERLAEHARGWCAASDETAASNMIRFVRLAAAQGKRARPVHDAWLPINGEDA